MLLAMQVWLYKFCSSVDLQIIVKHVSRIPRLLNWETADKRPHFETFIEGMLVDVDNPVTMTVFLQLQFTCIQNTLMYLLFSGCIQEYTNHFKGTGNFTIAFRRCSSTYNLRQCVFR